MPFPKREAAVAVLIVLIIGISALKAAGVFGDHASETAKLCRQLQAPSPVSAQIPDHPTLTQLLAFPFTDSPANGHYDLIVYLKPRYAAELPAVAARLRQQPNVVKVIEVDQQGAYKEFKSFGLATRVNASIKARDLPPSARVVMSKPSQAEALAARINASNPAIDEVSVTTGPRWVGNFASSIPLRDTLVSVIHSAPRSDLPDAGTLAQAWLDDVTNVGTTSDEERRLAGLFPSTRLDDLQTTAQRFLRDERRVCG